MIFRNILKMQQKSRRSNSPALNNQLLRSNGEKIIIPNSQLMKSVIIEAAGQ